MDIFNIIMHCLVFHVFSGAAAAYYAYRRCKVVGAAYSYGILSASVLWSVIGTLLSSTYCRENAPEVFCTHLNEELVVPVECCRAFAAEAEKHKMKVGAYYYNLSREGQGHGIWIPEKLPEKELYPDISANIIYFINHIINRKQQP